LSVAISSTDPERSFSCLRRLKSYLRNKMHGQRLSDLAVLTIEPEELNKIDIEKIINEFAETDNK
jgi:hypothetical protein